MAQPTVAGVCCLCDARVSKAAMQRHLKACLATHEAGAGPSTDLVHLRVESRGPWWLDIEAPATATLRDLDQFLRHAWLDCCGHMSAFYRDRSRAELKMNAKLADIFGEPATAIRYEYDFGSTTELRLRGVGWRSGNAGKRRARLLGRNEPPQWTCGDCGQSATQICPFSGDECFLCDTHSDEHPCDDSECHLPVVNSPRMGVCGYTEPMG